MAYNKYTWVDGEPITARRMNHIENGIYELYGGTPVDPDPDTAVMYVRNGDSETITFTGTFWEDGAVLNEVTISANEEQGFYVVLDNAEAVVEYSGGSGVPNVSGNVTRDGSQLNITGDCEIEFGGR